MAGSLVIATHVPPAPTPRPVLLNSDPYLDRIARPFARVMRMVSGGSDPGSLSGRAAQSGVWIGGGFVIQRVLQLGSNLILTRLLFPEAFGLMALSTVFLVGLQMFSDLGIKPAIIRDPRGNDPAFLNTAWTIQVIRGFALCVVGCLLAYPISLIYKQPILFPLLTVLSTTAAIAGFTSVKMSTAERDLDFRTVTFIQLAGQLATIITMVVLAYTWRSVWALAVGNIVGSLATAVLGFWLLQGHTHKFRLEPAAAKSLVHFGKWIFLSTIVTFIGGEGLKAIQGGLITPAEFGILAIAYTIAAIPIELSMKLTTSIGLPALSEIHRSDPQKLRGVLSGFRKRIFILTFFLVSVVVLTSETVIRFLYDQRYHEAGQFVVAITLGNAVAITSSGYNSGLLALGKSKTYLILIVLTAISRIIGIVSGFMIYDMLGMFVGIGIANVAVLIASWSMIQPYKMRDIKLDFSILAMISFLTLAVIAL